VAAEGVLIPSVSVGVAMAHLSEGQRVQLVEQLALDNSYRCLQSRAGRERPWVTSRPGIASPMPTPSLRSAFALMP
jgi:hypothetical protein